MIAAHQSERGLPPQPASCMSCGLVTVPMCRPADADDCRGLTLPMMLLILQELAVASGGALHGSERGWQGRTQFRHAEGEEQSVTAWGGPACAARCLRTGASAGTQTAFVVHEQAMVPRPGQKHEDSAASGTLVVMARASGSARHGRVEGWREMRWSSSARHGASDV